MIGENDKSTKSEPNEKEKKDLKRTQPVEIPAHLSELDLENLEHIAGSG